MSKLYDDDPAPTDGDIQWPLLMLTVIAVVVFLVVSVLRLAF